MNLINQLILHSDNIRENDNYINEFWNKYFPDNMKT